MEKELSSNQKVSVIKKIYRKIVFHFLIDKLIMPILSFIAVSLKATILLMLKPLVAITTLIMGFVSFMSQSVASELSEVTSSEIAEESGSNILEIILDFFW